MVSVRTHEYPGFPTDLQAPMAVFMSQCTGEGTLLETIFDGRFRYVDELVRMGADITVMNPHKILVRGPTPLSRKELEGPDLRAGLAYIMAATVAEGTSTISNAYVIDRGYERIEERLQKLGLNIKREEI
jgi:UDP-N-acetylglucosamine 1-carboxyvinyltransferase